MSFGWDSSQIDLLIRNRIQAFGVTFLLVMGIIVIFLLPLFIALLKDLSLKQIFIIFLATIFGVWVAGFLLSCIFKKKL